MARGLAVWLIIIVAETVHGILRGLFLTPRVGEVMASRIGWPVGMVIVYAIAILLAPWADLRAARSLLTLGAVWALLTLVFEVGIGLLRGYDWPRIAAEMNPLSGGLMLYTLVAMFLAPLIAARLRGL